MVQQQTLDTVQRNDYDDDASSITTNGSVALTSSPSFVGSRHMSQGNWEQDLSNRKRLSMDELIEHVPHPCRDDHYVVANENFGEGAQAASVLPPAMSISAHSVIKIDNSRRNIIRRMASFACLGLVVVAIAVVAGIATARMMIARGRNDGGTNATTSPVAEDDDDSPPAIDEAMIACIWPNLQDCGTEIIFSHIELTGSIPSTIKLATNLTHIDCVGTALTGSIPSELGLLTALTYLRLHVNQLTGTIPSELGLLSKLTWLDLSQNELVGSIPTELGALTHLLSLDLRYNLRMESTLPTEIGMLAELRKLTVARNSQTGTIPTAIGSLTNIESLGLEDNYLSGTIPTEIGLLTSIQILSLRRNSLSGIIPTEVNLLSNLQVLEIAYNDLSGPLPLEVCLLNGTTLFVACPIECSCCQCVKP